MGDWKGFINHYGRKWDMRLILSVITALGLTACNTPSGDFRGSAPTRITVDGSTFDVRQDQNRAEAIRVNAQYAPRFGPIHDRAGRAMATVTGCDVVEVSGDQAQAFGRLDCGNGHPPKRQGPVAVDCIPVYGSGVGVLDAIARPMGCHKP